MIAGALLSIVLTTGCKENRWTPMGSADLVLSEIKLRGATAVSRRLDTDENFGRTVMNGIATEPAAGSACSSPAVISGRAFTCA